MIQVSPYLNQKLCSYDEALQDFEESPGLQKLAPSSQASSDVTDDHGNPPVSV